MSVPLKATATRAGNGEPSPSSFTLSAADIPPASVEVAGRIASMLIVKVVAVTVAIIGIETLIASGAYIICQRWYTKRVGVV